jgi:uncharacterized protein YndB with AHSA1/START domain
MLWWVDDGSIEQHDGRVRFRYERRLRHPVETVWRAITDPAHIEAWIGARPEIDLRPGGEYVTYHGAGDRVLDHIVRLEPPRLLEHTFWQQVNPSALVTWELSPIPEGCRLLLTHALDLADARAAAETLARGDGIATILSRNGAGWHRLLDKLTDTLDGRTTPWSAADQQALRQRYAAQLG